MTSKLFIDTSGWVSLFVPSETYHLQAAQHFAKSQQQKQIVITTNYIVTEVIALLGSRQLVQRPQIFQYVDVIRTAPTVDLIYINETIDEIAWQLCKARPDKSWSLVDCSSFVLMQQLDIEEALTTDRHFEQAGFIRLLGK